MSDAKYFQRGKVQELRSELNSDRRDPKHSKKKAVLKRIVANMTMGNDMSQLFPDVLACIGTPSIEVKKMVYLFLINYARARPEQSSEAISGFLRDTADPNPLVRALAIRTMGYLKVDSVVEAFVHPLKEALHDDDPFVRKTAALGVAKLCSHDKSLVEREGLLQSLMSLLSDPNPTVVANAVASLTEISERSEDFQLSISVSAANKLINALDQSSEWGQVSLLEALLSCVPQEPGEAESLADRVVPRLQHSNAGVVLSAVKVIVYLMNYMPSQRDVQSLCRKLGPPLITLLNSSREIQYVTLRNILLILQRHPILQGNIHVFFCKYDDPPNVKLTKLDILYRLSTSDNVDRVLTELAEYATEVDVDFVRKSVRLIGKLAILIDSATERCITTLVRLVESRVHYVLQEAIIVIKDIFRKYPNRYEGIIGTLCDNLGDLDDPEAKVSMIWVVGQYAERIDHVEYVLEGFLDNFAQEPTQVKLALLTAVMKLFLKRPSVGQDLVPKVLKWATEDTDDPDVRDRGYIYWRLLSTDPVVAKEIILADQPEISLESSEGMAPVLLDELLLHISSLASIHHKPPSSFIPSSKTRALEASKVLVPRSSPSSAPMHIDLPSRHLAIPGNPYEMAADRPALALTPGPSPLLSSSKSSPVASTHHEEEVGEEGPQ
ncbi:MAG: adaptin N terminal region-domain-containing protein [Piptocephalis tieghemiana]|nr:MAG: adaptin N terminal region-domain-containing protein [Piptocephalis tieghemiana]